MGERKARERGGIVLPRAASCSPSPTCSIKYCSLASTVAGTVEIGELAFVLRWPSCWCSSARVLMPCYEDCARARSSSPKHGNTLHSLTPPRPRPTRQKPRLTRLRVDEDQSPLEENDNLLTSRLALLLARLGETLVLLDCRAPVLVCTHDWEEANEGLTKLLSENGVVATLVVKVDGVGSESCCEDCSCYGCDPCGVLERGRRHLY